MEAVQQRRPPSQGLKRFLATRRGAWTSRWSCASLARSCSLVFLNQYKSNVTAGARVARRC